MKIVLDTNIVLDVLMHREEFFKASYEAIKTALKNEYQCFVAASSVTDIFYILRRSSDIKTAKDGIIRLTQLVTICETLPADIMQALALDMNDFEDAVLASMAKRIKADYIITRNRKDFANSHVPAISPNEFSNN